MMLHSHDIDFGSMLHNHDLNLLDVLQSYPRSLLNVALSWPQWTHFAVEAFFELIPKKTVRQASTLVSLKVVE